MKQLQLELLDKMLAQRLYLCNMTVDWTIAQLVMPMEAVVADPPSPPWCCMESASAATQSASSGCEGTRQGAKIVIAGDFMTHSSYVGCYASADAAADAVVGGAGLR